MPATPEHSAKQGFLIPIGGAENRKKSGIILQRFVELCGGREAKILVMPTASQLDDT